MLPLRKKERSLARPIIPHQRERRPAPGSTLASCLLGHVAIAEAQTSGSDVFRAQGCRSRQR